MFEETKVLSFVPTAIWTHVLGPEEYEPLNERLKKSIYELMASLSETARQSRTDLHELKEFEELVPYIKQATSGALKFLHLDSLLSKIIPGPGIFPQKSADFGRNFIVSGFRPPISKFGCPKPK